MQRLTITVGLVVLFVAGASQDRRTIRDEDVADWEIISSARISPDGAHIAFQVNKAEGDGSLVVKSVDGVKEWKTPLGSSAQFSDDGKWVGYLISLPEKEVERLRREQKPVEGKAALRNLTTGDEYTFESVQSVAFLRTANVCALHRFRGRTKQTGGSDLTIVSLEDLSSVTHGNVSAYSATREGSILAAVIESDSGNSGVQLIDPRVGTLKSLAWSQERYSGLTWSRDGSTLAFYRGERQEKKDGDWNSIYLVKWLAGKPEVTIIDARKLEGFPAGMRIVESRGLLLSETGDRVCFGIRAWEDRRPPADASTTADLDIWHFLDIQIQPQQSRRAAAERQRSVLCSWEGGRLRVIGEDGMREGAITRRLDYALFIDERPYAKSATSGQQGFDVYLADLTTGEKTKIIEKTRFGASFSNAGRYVTAWRDGDWWLADTDTKKWVNLTEPANVDFSNGNYDGTSGAVPPAGQVTWLADDEGAFLYDDYDAWLYRPSGGSMTRATDGRKGKTRYRLTPTFADPEKGANSLGSTMLFSAFSTQDKRAGYLRVDADGSTLHLDAALFGGFVKARSADVVAFTRQSATEPENIYVSIDGSAGRRVSDANAQATRYLWTRTELVSYKSRWGAPLQGILMYPADYDARRQYPMIVSIYERLSDQLNAYVEPSNRSAYNTTWFTQNGYFVYMPDIAYNGIGEPGTNAKDCLEPALDAAFAGAGSIDRKRVGLMGHSWGGYQTAHMVSVSKYFRAGVAGAPLTNLVSMYGSVYWNSGTPDQELLETGQGRLITPYWEDIERYMRNSPIFNAEQITAPLMLAFGDQDGAVDWNQGVEMYITMRRLGKEVVMLVYPGENHGLAKRPNQIDYAKRVRHFFEHHLKGMPAEPWLKSGVPFVNRGGG